MYSVKHPPEEVLLLDIHFQDDLTPSNILTLTIELFKILLFQRKQVPESIDLIQREVSTSKYSRLPASLASVDGNGDADSAQHQREQLKRRREVERRRKLEQRYLKKAASVIEIFNRLTHNLRREIVDDANTQLEEVAFIFGATPVTPKEIYRLQLPINQSRPPVTSQGVNHRAMQQLFRTIITHEDLFNRIGKDLSVTNTYLAVKKSATTNQQMPSYFTTYEGFLEERRRNCKETVFTLRPQNNVSETPMRPKMRPASVSYTPCAMELCTPLQDRSNVIQINKNPELEITPYRSTTSKLLSTSARRQHGQDVGTVDRVRHLSGLEAIAEDEASDDAIIFKALKLDLNIESAAATEMSIPQPASTKSTWFFMTDHVKGFRDALVESA